MDEMEYWIKKLYEMEEKHLPELDHKDCGIIAELLIECKKSFLFVKHIEQHLENMPFLNPDDKKINVLCKICNKTIDEIYELEK